MLSPALTPVVQAVTPPATSPAPAAAQPGTFARELRSASAEAAPSDPASKPTADASDHTPAESASDASPRPQTTRRDLLRGLATHGRRTPGDAEHTQPVTDDAHAGKALEPATPRKGSPPGLATHGRRAPSDAEHTQPVTDDAHAGKALEPATPRTGSTDEADREAAAAAATALAPMPVSPPPDIAQAHASRPDGEPDAKPDLAAEPPTTHGMRKLPDSPRAPRHADDPAGAIGATEASSSPVAQEAAAPLAALGGNQSRDGAAAAPSAAGSTSSTSQLPFAAELARASHVGSAALDAGTAAPAQASIATPVHSPEFMPRLAGELLVLTKNGVHEARVQVHPAELGPIAVQISLDGSAAQIRLVADSAVTRSVLEQGMPTLAAALHESGLTLTGGGVFQQARDSQRDGAQDQAARQRSPGTVLAGDGEPAPVPAPRRLRPLSQIDLYA